MTTEWNLSELYADTNDPKIEQDIQRIKELTDSFQPYRGTIATLSPSEFLDFFKKSEERSRLMHRIGLFAGLLESLNVIDADITRFSKKIEERMTLIVKDTVFIDTEMAQMPEAKWQELLTSPELQEFHHFIESAHRDAKHTLSEPEEKILLEKSQTSWSALNHLFSVTTDTLSIEWDGETLTLEEALTKLRDPDSSVRKKAALTIHQALATNEKTTPPILNTLIQDKEISDRLRSYDYSEQARHHNDDVDKDTVQAMITAVNKSFDLTNRYYTLKRSF